MGWTFSAHSIRLEILGVARITEELNQIEDGEALKIELGQSLKSPI